MQPIRKTQILPLLLGFLLAAVIVLVAAVVYLLYNANHPPTTETISASNQQKEVSAQDTGSAPAENTGTSPAPSSAATPTVTQTVQGGQQQGAAQSSQSHEQSDSSTNAQLQQLIDTLNRNAGQPVVIVGNNPSPGQVVIRPDISPRDTTELEALQAAVNYYTTAQRGDYAATYRMLADADKAHYSQDEWVRANQKLDTAAGKFIVRSATRVGSDRYQVDLTVYLADGSSFRRQTDFILQNGQWRHDLTSEERKMFDGAL